MTLGSHTQHALKTIYLLNLLPEWTEFTFLSLQGSTKLTKSTKLFRLASTLSVVSCHLAQIALVISFIDDAAYFREISQLT